MQKTARSFERAVLFYSTYNFVAFSPALTIFILSPIWIHLY